ncbi:MAG: alanine dehydrogenase [Bacteroidetes bacterium]|nr:alanine dehydrogenase [Bacteroidota bacterium]MDA0902948.1 alanine dehydrogenase [Bacteroidota bacterium]MDA1241636.1 alanine dehydrogenase [Bacteroidota bacterium]
MDSGRKAIKALAREAALLPQEELLQVKAGQADLTIGIPAETSLQEKRVALVPEAVALLVAHGHHVLVETQAGAESQFSDSDYSEAGARIVYDRRQVFQSHIVLKVEPPSLEEVELMGMRQTLISALQLSVQNEGMLQALMDKKTTAIAWDFVQNENGIQPLVRAMGEIAGNTAVLVAGGLMASESGQGTMLGGVSGVRPSEVVIIGAGTVGEFAARSALGLGASVKVFDNSVHRLIRLQNALGQRVWTSTLQPSVLEEALRTADVAIGAVRGEGSRAPMIVSEPMVAGMRNRAIVVDVSIDRGGVFETSRLTSHERPTFIECGVIHYCVPNIPSRVARTASKALSNIFAPMLLGVASDGGVESSVRQRNLVSTGIYMFNGTLTNEEIAADRNLPWKPLDLLTATL